MEKLCKLGQEPPLRRQKLARRVLVRSRPVDRRAGYQTGIAMEEIELAFAGDDSLELAHRREFMLVKLRTDPWLGSGKGPKGFPFSLHAIDQVRSGCWRKRGGLGPCGKWAW